MLFRHARYNITLVIILVCRMDIQHTGTNSLDETQTMGLRSPSTARFEQIIDARSNLDKNRSAL